MSWKESFGLIVTELLCLNHWLGLAPSREESLDYQILSISITPLKKLHSSEEKPAAVRLCLKAKASLFTVFPASSLLSKIIFFPIYSVYFEETGFS